ncbi:MAG: hypothetical protein ACR2P1_27480 [Pseudomonadales bacterium]
MKQEDEQTTNHESDFLRKVFAEPGQSVDDIEAVPLVDIPAGLTEKLYAIADSETEEMPDHSRQTTFSNGFFSLVRLSKLPSWKTWGGVAASVVMVAVMLQMNEQRKTIAQLEQAQQDLTIAFRYLNETNKAVEARLVDTLGNNMQKAVFAPVVHSVNAIELPQIDRKKRREL